MDKRTCNKKMPQKRGEKIVEIKDIPEESS